jgi:hypothetical protein
MRAEYKNNSIFIITEDVEFGETWETSHYVISEGTARRLIDELGMAIHNKRRAENSLG